LPFVHTLQHSRAIAGSLCRVSLKGFNLGEVEITRSTNRDEDSIPPLLPVAVTAISSDASIQMRMLLPPCALLTAFRQVVLVVPL
jgi:hypothetical protein